MKMVNFIQSPISHNLRDPHSKALEPDRLSPPLAITTQSLWARSFTVSLTCSTVRSPVFRLRSKGPRTKGRDLPVKRLILKVVPLANPFSMRTSIDRSEK